MNPKTAPERLVPYGTSSLPVDITRPPIDISSTPLKVKTHSVSVYSSSEIMHTADKNYINLWAKRVDDNNRVCQDINQFLRDFVPGEDPPASMECPDGIFGDFKPDGSNEDCVGMVCYGFTE
jgi:hypothetical protein